MPRTRAQIIFTPVLAVFVVAVPGVAQQQFSRAAFYDAIKAAAPTKSWNEVVFIPQLSAVTDGKKASYMLALAYLASQECGPAIVRADESKNYLLLKADGLFSATGYDPGNATHVAAKRAAQSMGLSGRVQIIFASAFRSAASELLQSISSSSGKCQFSSGWYRNDTRELEFLRRTCADLREQMYPALQHTSPTDLILPEVRAVKETQNNAAGPTVEGRTQQIEEAFERATEEKLRAEAEALERATEEKLRAEAEGARRAKQVRDAQQDRFEASARGTLLFSVLGGYSRATFARTNPSPLPSERTAAEAQTKVWAKCVVRQLTPNNPDNMSADEKATIDMIITDLRGTMNTIRNSRVAILLARTSQQCLQELADTHNQ